jgi:hypothetical protein
MAGRKTIREDGVLEPWDQGSVKSQFLIPACAWGKGLDLDFSAVSQGVTVRIKGTIGDDSSSTYRAVF